MSEHDGGVHGSGFWGGMGGLQTMGLLNSLRTGDPTIDLFLAMCIPLLFQAALSMMGKFQDCLDWEEWQKWWFRRRYLHQRFITYRSTRNSWGGVTSDDEDTQNTVLLKAIQLYLHSQAKLKLMSADMNLTSTEDKNANLGISSHYDDDYDEDGRRNQQSNSIVGALSKFKIIKKPMDNEWHKLGSYGNPPAPVELRIQLHEATSGDPNGNSGNSSNNARTSSTKKVFHFTSTKGHAIDAFINTAFDWYLDELRKLEDDSRYLYELVSYNEPNRAAGQDDGSSPQGCVYRRYKLSDEKTFESLFFRQKESLLALVNHFQNRSGKYAIKGYPHKLGILLHGPPGSGKTSLIKAMAQYTKRSIINVPLARIKTNAELMSIFFDIDKHVQGSDVAVKLDFKHVIFVMEDVDASSKIVKRRDGKKATADTTTVQTTEHFDVPPPKSVWRMLLESTEEDCKELVGMLMEKSDRLRQEATKPEVLKSVAQRMMVLPGLGLVGEAASSDDPAVEKIGEEAVESANRLMDNYSTVDRFVSTHARSLKALVETGAEVDDEFVDELLGVTMPSVASTLSGITNKTTTSSLARDINYTRYDETGHLHVEAAEKTSTTTSATALMASMAQMVGETSRENGKDGNKVVDGFGMIGPSPWGKHTKDQLNLSGLLNVLDGVVDSPGRVVIMTTNHPEQLDPALIRPGRIDKKLHLCYMEAEDIVAMLEHYFQISISDEQKSRVFSLTNGNKQEMRPRLKLTPAQVEQLAAEHDEVEEMILALEAEGQSIVLPPHGHASNVLGTSSASALAHEG